MHSANAYMVNVHKVDQLSLPQQGDHKTLRRHHQGYNLKKQFKVKTTTKSLTALGWSGMVGYLNVVFLKIIMNLIILLGHNSYSLRASSKLETNLLLFS